MFFDEISIEELFSFVYRPEMKHDRLEGHTDILIRSNTESFFKAIQGLYCLCWNLVIYPSSYTKKGPNSFVHQKQEDGKRFSESQFRLLLHDQLAIVCLSSSMP